MNKVRLFKGYDESQLMAKIAQFAETNQLNPIQAATTVDRDHSVASYIVTVIFEPIKKTGFSQGGYTSEKTNCDKCGRHLSQGFYGVYCLHCEPEKRNIAEDYCR